MGFEKFRSADSVVVATNLNEPLRTIRDTQTLVRLATFAVEHKGGWVAPWYGTPVARIQAQFYRGPKFLGDLGVGDDFLVAQGCGYFYARSVSPPDRTAIMGLLNVPDPYAGSSR